MFHRGRWKVLAVFAIHGLLVDAAGTVVPMAFSAEPPVSGGDHARNLPFSQGAVRECLLQHAGGSYFLLLLDGRHSIGRLRSATRRDRLHRLGVLCVSPVPAFHEIMADRFHEHLYDHGSLLRPSLAGIVPFRIIFSSPKL